MAKRSVQRRFGMAFREAAREDDFGRSTGGCFFTSEEGYERLMAMTSAWATDAHKNKKDRELLPGLLINRLLRSAYLLFGGRLVVHSMARITSPAAASNSAASAGLLREICARTLCWNTCSIWPPTLQPSLSKAAFAALRETMS